MIRARILRRFAAHPRPRFGIVHARPRRHHDPRKQHTGAIRLGRQAVDALAGAELCNPKRAPALSAAHGTCGTHGAATPPPRAHLEPVRPGSGHAGGRLRRHANGGQRRGNTQERNLRSHSGPRGTHRRCNRRPQGRRRRILPRALYRSAAAGIPRAPDLPPCQGRQRSRRDHEVPDSQRRLGCRTRQRSTSRLRLRGGSMRQGTQCRPG